MEPLSRKKRYTYLGILTLIFVIGGPLLIGYSFGYRISNIYLVSSTGGINVVAREPNVQIYIDNELVKETNILQKKYFAQNIKPGTHLVRVEKENFYSWSSFVEVYPEYVSSIYPLIIAKTVDAVEIPAFNESTDLRGAITHTPNPEYTKIEEIFALQKKATTTLQARTYKDIIASYTSGKFMFSWDGSRNDAPYYFCTLLDCVGEVSINVPLNTVRDFDFFPGREDALLVSTDAGLFVTSIDSDAVAQFFPLYVGGAVRFYVEKGDKIYVQDGEKIVQLKL